MADKNDILCTGCRKKIAEGTMHHGKISIKCKCGVVNTISATAQEVFPVEVIKQVSGLSLGTFVIDHIST